MILSILHWNIWYEEDARNIATALKEHPADIVCLQELSIGYPGGAIHDVPAYLAEQLGYHSYYKELPIESTDGSKLTLADGIFSKYPIKDSRYTWINQPKAGGGYNDEYRVYVEIDVEIEGKKLTVATSHMSYTDRFEPTESKKHETDLLVGELKKHHDRFVFTGDLNAQPGSYTINAISDVLQNAGPDESQKTWTTKPFSYNGFEAKSLDWRLDYVFTTPDIKVESAEVLKTDYSDHLPILAKLSF
jgi:endonuclease/exonuclease/phosphatase family metal-dependent hydrolase